MDRLMFEDEMIINPAESSTVLNCTFIKKNI